MTDKEVMQQALEAMETCGEDEWHSEDDFGMVQTYDEDKVAKAITALRTALEQQQAEPVAWNAGVAPMWPQQKEGETFLVSYTPPPQQQAEPPPEWPLIKNILAVFGLDAISFVAEWKAAQKAEPVLQRKPLTNEQINMENFVGSGKPVVFNDLTTPSQRQWVGLTDEDVRQCSQDVVAGGSENSVDRFAYAIEAKLKEKNDH